MTERDQNRLFFGLGAFVFLLFDTPLGSLYYYVVLRTSLPIPSLVFLIRGSYPYQEVV